VNIALSNSESRRSLEPLIRPIHVERGSVQTRRFHAKLSELIQSSAVFVEPLLKQFEKQTVRGFISLKMIVTYRYQYPIAFEVDRRQLVDEDCKI